MTRIDRQRDGTDRHDSDGIDRHDRTTDRDGMSRPLLQRGKAQRKTGHVRIDRDGIDRQRDGIDSQRDGMSRALHREEKHTQKAVHVSDKERKKHYVKIRALGRVT